MDRDDGVRDIDIPGCSGFGVGGKSSDAFIDRSRVRILLCDNNLKSSEEAFTLLCKCSYQVTSVKSARQVIDALNAEGPDIDIILSEVDLPMAKGMKMLKYIMRDKDLRRIPVIMMSAQDEVSIVVKCLRLGAADYLVKPLRTNELLNLWTHMWRRRRMLGLTEKNIMNYEFDPVASGPSDANTNSTTLFSDDTDDKSRKSTNPEIFVPAHQEAEHNASVAASLEIYAPLEQSLTHFLNYRPDVPGISDRRTENSHAYKAPLPRERQIASCPKKSELRIGESSAFFTYVKSPIPRTSTQVIIHDLENTNPYSSTQENLSKRMSEVANDTQDLERADVKENETPADNLTRVGSSRIDTYSQVHIDPRSDFQPQTSPTPPVLTEYPQLRNSRTEAYSRMQIDPRGNHQADVANSHSQSDVSMYNSSTISVKNLPTPPLRAEFPQLRNSRTEMYSQMQIDPRGNHQADMANSNSQNSYPYFQPGFMNQAMMAQYPHFVPSFPYYPMGLCLQPGQILTPQHHQWPSFGTDVKLSKVNRREAALMKFRQKRKERCFNKKIRYVNRKHLAERRPRVRGQFVRKMNGINVDLNGTPGSVDLEEDDDEEDEEEPEDDA